MLITLCLGAWFRLHELRCDLSLGVKLTNALGRENLVRASRLRVLGGVLCCGRAASAPRCCVQGCEPPTLPGVLFLGARAAYTPQMLFLGARAAGPHCATRVVLRLENYIVMCLIARSGAYQRAWV